MFENAIEVLDRLLLLNVITDTQPYTYSIHSVTRSFVLNQLKSDISLQDELYSKLAKWTEIFVRKHGGYKNWLQYPQLNLHYKTIINVLHWYACQESQELNRSAISIWRQIDHYLSVRLLQRNNYPERVWG